MKKLNWSNDDIRSEIEFLYVYLESTRDRVNGLIKNPNSKVEKETWEHCVEKRLAELLFTRSYDYEKLALMYSDLSYYAKKCNCYKEDADYIEKVFRNMLEKIHYYYEKLI